jgi:hypothetical protein
MSLPKHGLRIYLDAETKAGLDAYAEALGVEDGKAAAEIRAGLVRIGRD